CHIDTGADWSQLTQMEAGLLCKNHGLTFWFGDYAKTLSELRQYARDMEYSTVTSEQMELFNEGAEALKNKYPDSNTALTKDKKPSTPSEPKTPTQSRPPSSKGATGRVWAI